MFSKETYFSKENSYMNLVVHVQKVGLRYRQKLNSKLDLYFLGVNIGILQNLLNSAVGIRNLDMLYYEVV